MAKPKRIQWRLAAGAALACGLLATAALTGPGDRYFEIAKNLEIFAAVYREVNNLYVEEINPNTLMRSGADSMLISLDPYTNYIPEDEVENFRTQNTGQYGGIGALTRQMGNRTVVTMVYEGFPAAKGGMKIGDEILKIDQVPLASITLEEANRLMRGQLGTPVTLTIRRPGKPEPFTLDFKRDRIKISNVPFYGMVNPATGYIQLVDFTPDAGAEVREAMFRLKEKGARALVLDLRNNPGGLLMEAVNICNLFLPKGKKVVSTRGKLPDSNMTYETRDNPADLDIPLVVLINRSSASASEIVAGTLQDFDRAVIVGEKSFGKGLVQMQRDLTYKAKAKITTARYYTASGRCIQLLDYSHRAADGRATSVPDSVKKEFKTSRGRRVFDGGGIDPDVALTAAETPPVLRALVTSGLLFDFATHYALRHPTIAPAGSFRLSAAGYQDFTTWLNGRSYPYTTPLENELKKFEAIAAREKYNESVKPQADVLRRNLLEARKRDLQFHQDAITAALEAEIASRYYLERGRTEVGFQRDPELKAAAALLADTKAYRKILNLE